MCEGTLIRYLTVCKQFDGLKRTLKCVATSPLDANRAGDQVDREGWRNYGRRFPRKNLGESDFSLAPSKGVEGSNLPRESARVTGGIEAHRSSS